MIVTNVDLDPELRIEKAKMLGSLLYFIQCFYFFRTGRKFSLSKPIGRESHHITVCRELTKVFNLETNRLLINLPPGHYKSTILQHFIAWAWAHYPDCQFVYLSYSHGEASKNTAVIKDIISLPQYRQFFGVSVDPNASAKDDFKTTGGGMIKAFGSRGAVTGKDAGFPDCDRYSGGLIMDDMHKPDEVHSDTTREKVIKNYQDTAAQRVRGPKVSQIFLGQCLREEDLADWFKKGKDGYDWTKVVLMGLDDNGNALDPNVKTRDELIKLREFSRDVFWAQYQQKPQPPGGSVFLENDFKLLDQEPDFVCTFITGDTAETSENYNDPTVFSFWGVYRIRQREIETDLYGLHLIHCIEQWIEPKHLESEFFDFYAGCMRHKAKPQTAIIEKKSTGVTLISILNDVQGLRIVGIERTKASGSKTARYIEMQPYIAAKRISVASAGKLWVTKDNKLVNMFINHMGKITRNNTHKHDDICDTAYDAVKAVFIDETLPLNLKGSDEQARILSSLSSENRRMQNLRDHAYD